MVNEKKIIQTVYELTNRELNKEEIIQKMDIKKSTFYKYMNIFKEAGFIINKSPNAYCILNFQEILNLKSFETSLLGNLLFSANIYLPKKKLNMLENAVEKMLCLTNEDCFQATKGKFDFYKRIEYSELYYKKIQYIKNNLEQKKQMKILTNKKEEIKALPEKIIWEEKKPKLQYVDIDTNKSCYIGLDKIVKIMDIDEIVFGGAKNETIFELHKNLASSYLLKEKERVVDSSKGKLVIANAQSDRKALFKRLLRYDVLCKVLLPKSAVKEFEKMIKKSFENIKKV